MVFSTVLDYNCGLAIYKSNNKKTRKLFLGFSLLGNLGLLAFFKYSNFFIDSLNSLLITFNVSFQLPILNVILPIGISFYTFQTLSYTLDIYWGKLKPTKSLMRFGLFVTFFPQLVAGPIVRAIDFLPQLERKIIILSKNVKSGLTLVMWGLVKKIIFADNIAPLVNNFLSTYDYAAGSLPIILVTVAFGIQIYCDFSGYSDIAIGIAKIFGFNLRLNFDKPYFSKSITEFWRKWHMSLSSWLRDYLYIPLGGNRKGKIRTYINLMITMILGGLWHGAAWNFILWGFFQGIGLAIHKFTKDHNMNNWFNYFGKYKKYVLLLFTQYFVFLGWLIFRVSDFKYLIYCIKQYLFLDFKLDLSGFIELMNSNSIAVLFIVLFLIVHIYTFFNPKVIDKFAEADYFYWALYLFIMCLLIFFLAPTESPQFIYFQF